MSNIIKKIYHTRKYENVEDEVKKERVNKMRDIYGNDLIGYGFGADSIVSETGRFE